MSFNSWYSHWELLNLFSAMWSPSSSSSSSSSFPLHRCILDVNIWQRHKSTNKSQMNRQQVELNQSRYHSCNHVECRMMSDLLETCLWNHIVIFMYFSFIFRRNRITTNNNMISLTMFSTKEKINSNFEFDSDFPVFFFWNVGWNGIEMKCEKFVEFPTKVL